MTFIPPLSTSQFPGPIDGKDSGQIILVGGFNPFEKYARQIGSFPQVGVKIKNIWNHHLYSIIFHQSGFPWNKWISLPKRYLLGEMGRVTSRANLTRRIGAAFLSQLELPLNFASLQDYALLSLRWLCGPSRKTLDVHCIIMFCWWGCAKYGDKTDLTISPHVGLSFRDGSRPLGRILGTPNGCPLYVRKQIS